MTDNTRSTIDNDRRTVLACPYHSCSSCHYVGREIDVGLSCPVCGHAVTNALSMWPHLKWLNAAGDILFLYEHKKLELLTIAIAAYFEGILYSFFDDAFHLIHPTTRSMDINVSHIPDECDRFVATQQEYSRRREVARTLLQKNEGRWKRMNRLFVRVFGKTFDEMLTLHYPKHAAFIKNRDNINDWRNKIVHCGISLEEVWPEPLRKAVPEIALQFVRDCWDVFRALNNELIHKRYWCQ